MIVSTSVPTGSWDTDGGIPNQVGNDNATDYSATVQ